MAADERISFLASKNIVSAKLSQFHSPESLILKARRGSKVHHQARLQQWPTVLRVCRKADDVSL